MEVRCDPPEGSIGDQERIRRELEDAERIRIQRTIANWNAKVRAANGLR